MIGEGVIFRGQGRLTDKGLSCLLDHHYLHRRPPMNHTFEWWQGDAVVGVITIGVPASRHLQIGVLPDSPNQVLELNRMWIEESQEKCSASWFISQCLKQLPPLIIVSYADTKVGHYGTVYRAANFKYAGWTDMDRKNPRCDYIYDKGHSRQAFRKGSGRNSRKVRRSPKAKYWTVTGTKREKKILARKCRWPSLSWVDLPPPNIHMQCIIQ